MRETLKHKHHKKNNTHNIYTYLPNFTTIFLQKNNYITVYKQKITLPAIN